MLALVDKISLSLMHIRQNYSNIKLD